MGMLTHITHNTYNTNDTHNIHDIRIRSDHRDRDKHPNDIDHIHRAK
jgi:hypothetical protein